MQPAETPSTDPAVTTSRRATLRSISRSPWLWLLLVTLALEFLLFDQVGARRYTAVYPRWNDQVQYLTEAYQAHEFARAHGFASGLWHAWVNPSAQGTLHDVLGLVAFTMAGPSRSAALALNLIALLAWQLALFAATLRVRVRPPLAFTAALLPLLLAGPWRNVPGSAFDFRLDHLTLCALGVASAAAVATDRFRTRPASLLFGAATGFTLLLRFLTGTYFLILFVALLVWTLRAENSRRRTTNLLLAAFVAALLAAPIFWLNRAAIRDYYWIGHYIGPESAIRAAHLGLGGSLQFVFTHLAQRHLGLLFAIVAVAIPAWLWLSRRRERAPEPADAAAELAILGVFFVVAPALILTFHAQKSEVVLSALAPGVVLLVIAGWTAAARHATAATQRGVAVATLLVGAASFVRTQVPPAFTPAEMTDIRRVNTIADAIFARAQAAHRADLRVGVDHITDCLDAHVLALICYERHRVWFRIAMTLPTGIAEPPDAVVMERLAASDFVFLTANDVGGFYPFDRKLAALRPELRAWCEDHLRPADQFTLFGRRMVLYQRPDIPLR